MALAVKQWSSGSGRPSSTTGPAPSKTLRTSASPDWAGEVPINFRKRLSLTAIPVAELELRHSLEACATIARSTELQIGITSDSLWILNRGTVGVDLAAGELFGFNVGTYQEVPSGSSCIPWLVTCDKTLVAMIGDASEKKLQTLADCMCDTVKNKGITELRVGPDGNATPLRYRYKITPAANVNSFKPKQVKVGEEVPAVLSPVKPKYYLLCSLSIP
ncbi:Uncharacterized protein SCF082_LOCUS23941, partial [Durusdinium trenchii]